MRALLLRLLVTSAALPFAAGCGTNAPPSWTRLVERADEATWSSSSQAGGLTIGGRRARVVSTDDETWLELTLPRTDWSRLPLGGGWAAPIAARFVGDRRRSESRYRLSDGDREFAPSRAHDATVKLSERVPVGSFYVDADAVCVRLEPGESPQAEIVLGVCLRSRDTSTRIYGRRFSGDGLPVFSGESVELPFEGGTGSVLRFATAVDALLLTGATTTPVGFRVLLDGVEVFAHEEPSATESSYAWHAIDLGEHAADGGHLTFEVTGPPAYTSFFSPIIGPREIGRPGARPWENARPDIVLFLADTFRADNLRVYGGDGATPALDALVPESLCFRRAWATSTYTLPSHTSLFSGIFPLQAGIQSFGRALPQELTTIAELLESYGYRTGAITDSGAVSKDFLFDQGFAWFDEHQRLMAGTIERAEDFLAADDGRPTFLFVQSYRAHRPYRVEELQYYAEDHIRGQKGPVPEGLAEFFEIETELVEIAHELGHPSTRRAANLPDMVAGATESERAMAELEAMYRKASTVLDRYFGPFQARLVEDGWLQDGYLIFTSDHGESFGEHGSLYHGNRTFEEETRIPLLIFGERVTPGIVEHAASLVDVSPTIAKMAGVPPLDLWPGSSLLDLERDRPIFSFQCRSDFPGGRSVYSVVDGSRKIIGEYDNDYSFDDQLYGAFDLEEDPDERAPLAGPGAAPTAEWPSTVFGRFAPALRELMRPVVGEQASIIGDEKAAELRALGYGE